MSLRLVLAALLVLAVPAVLPADAAGRDAAEELVQHALQMRDPLAKVSKLLGYAAKGNAALSERAEDALAKLPEHQIVRGCRSALSHPDWRVRRKAAAMLRDRADELDVPALAARAMGDNMEAVREAAMETLKKLDKEDPLVQAVGRILLESPGFETRVRAAALLGSTKDTRLVPVAIDFLIRRTTYVGGGSQKSYVAFQRRRSYIRRYETSVGNGAVSAEAEIAELNTGNALTAAVVAVRRDEIEIEARVIFESLRSLSGQDIKDDKRAWQRWWKQNGARMRADAETPGNP